MENKPQSQQKQIQIKVKDVGGKIKHFFKESWADISFKRDLFLVILSSLILTFLVSLFSSYLQNNFEKKLNESQEFFLTDLVDYQINISTRIEQLNDLSNRNREIENANSWNLTRACVILDNLKNKPDEFPLQTYDVEPYKANASFVKENYEEETFQIMMKNASLMESSNIVWDVWLNNRTSDEDFKKILGLHAQEVVDNFIKYNNSVGCWNF